MRLHGFGLAFMPESVVSAAQRALVQAGRRISEMEAIKTHNPFAVNDLYCAKQMGCDLKTINNYGYSMVWGHPQAPMGTRAIIDLIEDLAVKRVVSADSPAVPQATRQCLWCWTGDPKQAAANHAFRLTTIQHLLKKLCE